MGSVVIFILIFAIGSMISNFLEVRTKSIKDRKSKNQARQRTTIKRTKNNDSAPIIGTSNAEQIAKLAEQDLCLEKTQRQVNKNLEKATLISNDRVERRKMKDNFHLKGIFTPDHLLEAIILKEVLEPPKAISRK